MAIEGVDYAGSRPSPAGLYNAGKRFVVRYGGPGGSWKHLASAEADALLAAGLWLVANAEGTATGLLGGAAAGASWARSADAHFRALGMPADRPIYLSVDFDANSSHWAALDAAMDGAAGVIGRSRVGVYGGYDTIAHFAANGKAPWMWQTYAWSGGRWHPAAQLQQYRNHVPLAGGTVDLCRAMVADYGQWGQGDDDMATINQADWDALIWRVEAMANLTPTYGGGGSQQGKPVPFVAAIKALSGDQVDEAAIVAGVLAGLSPQAIADLVVAALPPELARGVADELAARLQA